MKETHNWKDDKPVTGGWRAIVLFVAMVIVSRTARHLTHSSIRIATRFPASVMLYSLALAIGVLVVIICVQKLRREFRAGWLILLILVLLYLSEPVGAFVGIGLSLSHHGT